MGPAITDNGMRRRNGVTRRDFLRKAGAAALGVCAASAAAPWRARAEPAAKRPNVLFICVDDLRPDLGAYGRDYMVTPHMDRFAGEGRLFQRHYVQAPSCGPSRYALLTGRHPTREHPVSFRNPAFDLYEESVAPQSMAAQFREHGYHTTLIGKVTHTPDGRRGDQDVRENRADNPPQMPGWDVLDTPTGIWDDAWSAFFAYAGGKTRTRGETPPVEAADVDDHGYPDGLLADAAIGHLERVAEQDEPFFLAVGFYKPHLPFASPQRYWDLYNRDAIELPAHREAPANVDGAISLRAGGEMFGNYDHEDRDPNEDDAHARRLIHGYRAAVSYVDRQVGRVLEAVDDFGLRDNTIVVIWGDHGFHLGEHGMWGKHTLHEESLRAAFLMRTPGMRQPGEATDRITATVDIYPTLMELCGIPAPDHLEGVSLAPLLDDPNASRDAPALGMWRIGGNEGMTVRTDRYRLVRWTPTDDPDTVAQLELYDHAEDPCETVNIAADHPDITERLLEMLP